MCKVYTKKSFKSVSAFTLVELMVATFIGTIILTFIFLFLGDIVDNISKAKKEVKSLSNFYDFSIKLNNYRNIYTTGSIIVDNGTGTGSDIFMLTDLNGSGGVLIGPIDVEEHKITINNKDHKNIAIGFRLLSEQNLIDIANDISVVHDYLFHKDQIFYDLKVQNMQLSMYNNSEIFDLELTVDTNYQDGLTGESRVNLPKDDLLKLNLNF